jgi:hypothetical protein
VKKNDTVAILGTATSTRKDAPLGKPGVDIWALGACVDWIAGREFQVHEWFELHRWDAIPKPAQELLGQVTGKLWLQEPVDGVRGDIFPIDKLVDDFGSDFTNSISYLIAHAIQRGYERIEIYGVDMAHDTEYNYQRPNCFYYIGLARGRGIEVYIPDGSALAKASRGGLYGYDVPDGVAQLCRERLKHFEAEIPKHEDLIRQHGAAIERYKGAKEMAEYVLQFGGHL